MKVFLLRHGYAGDQILGKDGERSPQDPKDLARSLDPNGIDAVTRLAAWMSDNDAVPTIIYHSPIRRAAQTAKILARALGVKAVPDQALELRKPVEMVIKRLAKDEDSRRVAIIAHHDNTLEGLRALNFLSGADKYEVDPMAMAELRILKVDRDTAMWDERYRVLPSDLGGTDYY